MPSSANAFIWYELMTTDLDAAEAFYKAVVGWSARDAGQSAMRYSVMSAGETGVAGIMTMPQQLRELGRPPAWLGYIGVDNVDAATAELERAGGQVHRGPADIPEIGRFSVVADPHGAAFMLFKPLPHEAPPARPPNTPGLVGWRELYAGDGPEAFEFYAGRFGWTRAEAMDMGPMGVYQLFAAGAEPIGGMMTKPKEMPAPPHWLFYFNVPALDPAIARVTGGGGTVINGPMEVPGGSWIVQCVDPQGAVFALVAPMR
jgi:predicted enzyme related to lactoylglutathione lyase